MLLDTAYFAIPYFDQSIAFTKGRSVIIEKPGETLQNDQRLFVATGDSSGQIWTRFEVLPCPYYSGWAAKAASVAGDTSGETAGVIGTFEDSTANLLYRPLFYRTTDGGQSWEDCVAMTDNPHVSPYYATDPPLNILQGKLWVLGWEHYLAGGNTWSHLGTRFSANHGRNWYPLQWAADTDYVRKFV
jgi:hypothetical protein